MAGVHTFVGTALPRASLASVDSYEDGTLRVLLSLVDASCHRRSSLGNPEEELLHSRTVVAVAEVDLLLPSLHPWQQTKHLLAQELVAEVALPQDAVRREETVDA